MVRALFLGNITIDRVEDHRIRVGGSGLYGGIALAEYLGAEVYVYTSVDEVYGPMIRSVLNSYGIAVLCKQCSSPTIFVIRGGKAVDIGGTGCKILMEEALSAVKVVRPKIILCTPVYRELDPYIVAELNREVGGAAILSMDIQGFVRIKECDRIGCMWSKDLEKAMLETNLAHGNISEYCFASSEHEVVARLRDLSSCAKGAIVASLDDRGCYVAIKGEVFRIPAPRVNAMDEVGAGDVLTAVASYFIASGHGYLESVARGVVAASLKTENPYGRWFDKESIENLSRELMKLIEAV